MQPTPLRRERDGSSLGARKSGPTIYKMRDRAIEGRQCGGDTHRYGPTAVGQINSVPIDEDFDGDFDAQTHILHGQVLGVCGDNVSWQKTR
jgi:hypothetical protein